MVHNLLLLAVLLFHASGADRVTAADEPPTPTCSLKLELVERKTGEALPGIVRIAATDGSALRPPELVNRGQGVDQAPIRQWSVVAASA